MRNPEGGHRLGSDLQALIPRSEDLHKVARQSLPLSVVAALNFLNIYLKAFSLRLRLAPSRDW